MSLLIDSYNIIHKEFGEIREIFSSASPNSLWGKMYSIYQKLKTKITAYF